MAEQHLRTLLEDAAANVPGCNMAAAALAGARRRRMRRHLTVAAGVTAAGVVLGAVAITSPDLSGGEKPAPAGPITKSQNPAPSLLPPSPSVQLPKTVADLP